MADDSSMRYSRDEEFRDRDDIPLKETGTEDCDVDKQSYPPGSKLAPILIGLCFQSFCIALDNTILSTAVPKITEQFNSLGDLSCDTLIQRTHLRTSNCRNWIGGLSPGALLVLANSVPLNRRALYFGIIGSISGIATITGPLWRWCFWINLPFGVITGLVIVLFFKDPTTPKPKLSRLAQIKRMDPFGILVFIPAIVSLLLCLQWGGTRYNWDNARIIALFVLFGIFSCAWCGIQLWKQDEATVPPRLLKNRNVLGAVIHATFLGGSFFVFGYYLPIWFQAVKETSAAQSGINNLPMVVSMIVCSALGGLLVNLVGYYTPLMFIGSAFLTIGSGLCTSLDVNSGYPQWIGYQVILGIGAGLGFQQCINALQTVLPLQDIPVGIAIITFAQSLSGAMFISIAQTVFENRLVASIAANAPKVNPEALTKAGATNLSLRVSKEILPSVLKAYNIAVTQTFYVSVAAAILSFIGAGLVQWKSMRRPQKIDGTD
ncbi:hypothetical protein N7457_001967 [Penicillium paradoxum]|uniref:uncharacterized protein n=1 Tax=Penicillium paradoxum TaxID=176176 RepID=UPI002547059D|nr:uncharacterized protein N7457_001967 [Penicillium paradoxum]KAJ5786977.1 hypothetical protein N7457_001967 [Penicillium paradoxum]